MRSPLEAPEGVGVVEAPQQLDHPVHGTEGNKMEVEGKEAM